jgi:hypothetical protein
LENKYDAESSRTKEIRIKIKFWGKTPNKFVTKVKCWGEGHRKFVTKQDAGDKA